MNRDWQPRKSGEAPEDDVEGLRWSEGLPAGPHSAVLVREVAAVVLGAGTGSRLRPLTDLLPKALCPVNNVALVDHAMSAVGQVTSSVAVNASYMAGQLVSHVGHRAHLSVEPEPLGTAGALGALRGWIDGRSVLVHNADSWHRCDLKAFQEEWDGMRVRLLVRKGLQPHKLGTQGFCGVSLMPWNVVRTLQPRPSGLWEVSWKRLWECEMLDLVEYGGPFFDCGTAGDYLAANMCASDNHSVVGANAVVAGSIERSVVWPDARVDSHEQLVNAIRATGGITVQT